MPRTAKIAKKALIMKSVIPGHLLAGLVRMCKLCEIYGVALQSKR
jgi:hypothetical protein